MPTRRAILNAGTHLALLLLGGCATVHKDARVQAFVVGADYPRFSKNPGDLGLHNAVKDATTIARSLDRTANCASPMLVLNPCIQDWQEKLALYREAPQEADFTVFYYAGHAFQSGAQLAFLCDDGTNAVSAEQVLEFLLQTSKGVFFIVDACRVPLPEALQRQGLDGVDINDLNKRGSWPRSPVTLFDLKPETFRRVKPSDMTLPQAHRINLPVSGRVKFLYSTDGQQFASDGVPGEGGTFARIAAKELARRSGIETVVRRITDKVSQKTKWTQTPASSGDLSFPMFIAGPPNTVSVAKPSGDPGV